MKRFLLAICLIAFVTMGAVSPPGDKDTSREPSPPDEEAFPIKIEFDCPRDFGFHIGDEIPVTMTLEAREGTVVDLVNLPQKNDTHGPFEVREMKVRKRREHKRTIYTVSFRLQCFTPALAVDNVSFPPLRISYATQQDWDPMESKYRYNRLFSQPFEILVSRTATYFGPMKNMKGPITDSRVAPLWKAALAVGGLMVFAALISWPWNFIRRQRAAAARRPDSTARERALKALQDARENCFNYEDHRKRLYFEVNAILRDFLKEVFALRTANRPSMQMMDHLKGRPGYEELRDLVGRINQVIYEGHAPVDVESVVRQFSGLLQKLDGTPSAVNHDKAG